MRHAKVMGRDPLNSERRGKRKAGSVVTCDYNGWTDAPEEEREWFDQHPEIWNGTFRHIELRRNTTTRRIEERHVRGDIAA
jgi:hypothetical protein